jgi:hypothetical protein
MNAPLIILFLILILVVFYFVYYMYYNNTQNESLLEKLMNRPKSQRSPLLPVETWVAVEANSSYSFDVSKIDGTLNILYSKLDNGDQTTEATNYTINDRVPDVLTITTGENVAAFETEGYYYVTFTVSYVDA